MYGALKFGFSAILAVLLLSSCGRDLYSGSGYFIGNIDPNKIGSPIFKQISPKYGSVTYIDRKKGTMFISAASYSTLSGITMSQSGREPFPNKLSLENSGI